MTAEPAAETDQPELGQARLRRLAVAVADAAAFYAEQLTLDQRDAERTRALLAARGVPADAVRNCQLGYAPAGWTHLLAHLSRRGHSPADLVEAGLCARTRTGHLIDRFRDRLILPIHDPHNGQPVAFLARAVPPAGPAAATPRNVHGPTSAARPSRAAGTGAEEKAKYLNSPRTPLYCKSSTVYGLGTPAAQQALAAGARVVLVEGPLDALAVTYAHPHGSIPSSPGFVGVASCGTALTANQVTVLRRCAGAASARPIVAFDADAAGRAAAARALPLLLTAGTWPDCAQLPDGLDPAALSATLGPEALLAALHSAVPLADVAVRLAMAPYAGQQQWAEGVLAAGRAAARVIATLPAAQMARQVQRVAEHLDLTSELVTELVIDQLSPASPAARSRPSSQLPASSPVARLPGPNTATRQHRRR